MRRLYVCSALALQLHAAPIVAMVAYSPSPRTEAEPEIDVQPALVGTLEDLPGDSDHAAEAVAGVDVPSASPGAHASAPAAAPPPRGGVDRPAPQSASRSGKAQTGSPKAGSDAARPAGLFGAVGDRAAADLLTAFTRGFPQAASTDPVWAGVPFGSAGTADVVITLDEGGHVEHTEIRGAPTAALRAGITRTMALIGRRAFTSRSRVTSIHLVARVSRDEVHDGLHGEVFAIGQGANNAFFALAIGRRIDLDIGAK